jgi:hypothetical protein
VGFGLDVGINDADFGRERSTQMFYSGHADNYLDPSRLAGNLRVKLYSPLTVHSDMVLIELVHVIVIEIDPLPGGTIMLDGLSILEIIATVEAPQLPTPKTPAYARIIDFRVVFTITCLRAATLRAVAHHDSIDKIFTRIAFVERIAKFADQIRTHRSQHVGGSCLFFC